MKVDNLISRREFLALSAASAAAAASGCATNPVTGQRQIMFVSEAREIDIDRQWSPHQFSADYGQAQDYELNTYLATVGDDIARLTHRPHMPYSFRAVNSAVVNGYTFPGGSVALCRGLILACRDEAELAAVLGHELGHVNARHAGQRMTQGILAGILVAGVSAYVAKEKEQYAGLAAGLGGIGASLLLARYSREDEREADALGMEYMTRADYNPRGMVALMDTFQQLHRDRPGAVSLLFATHPLSDERYRLAKDRAERVYASAADYPVNRERFMDRTAGLRAKQAAIEALQKGEQAMRERKYPEAEGHFGAALRMAPDDYAGLLMMAKCQLAQQKHGEAQRYAEAARAAYPEEAQADHVEGMSLMMAKNFVGALRAFSAYERRLPGNPNTVFYRALCLDQVGRQSEAAGMYAQYLRVSPSGEFAQHASNRLREWGYLKEPEQAGGK